MLPPPRVSRFFFAATGLALAFALVACGATRARRGAPEESGFLRDYSQRKHNPDYPAAEVYVNPDAVWSRYDAIEIDSVTLWVSKEEGVLKEQERQMLARFHPGTMARPRSPSSSSWRR
jgi:hypothetical protein